MSNIIPEVKVIGGRKKATKPKGSASFNFHEEEINILVENQPKRYEVETSYTPTNYVSMEEDKSSLIEIQKGEKKATRTIFGIVKPGDGLDIIEAGILNVKIGRGLLINPISNRIEVDTEFGYEEGENISFTLSSSGGTKINVSGENEVREEDIRIPTSKAIASYTRKITGYESQLDDYFIGDSGKANNLVEAVNLLGLRSNYTHTQSLPSNEWVITHPLKKKPSVITMNENGVEMIGNVEYPSVEQVIVRFTASFSGSAVLN